MQLTGNQALACRRTCKIAAWRRSYSLQIREQGLLPTRCRGDSVKAKADGDAISKEAVGAGKDASSKFALKIDGGQPQAAGGTSPLEGEHPGEYKQQ